MKQERKPIRWTRVILVGLFVLSIALIEGLLFTWAIWNPQNDAFNRVSVIVGIQASVLFLVTGGRILYLFDEDKW